MEGRVGAARAVGQRPAAWSSPAWAARRSAARSPAPRSATSASRPIVAARAYGLPAWTHAGHDRAVRELLGRHRGDARLLRGGRRARRAARIVVTTRRRAGRAGARGRRAGDPGRRRPAAARRRRLHDRRRARGRVRCAAPGPRCARRSTSPPSTSRSWSSEWGPDGAEDSEAKALARGLHGTIPVDRRRGPDRRRSPTAGRPSSTRTPRSRPSRTSCPSSTTTRSSAGRRAASSAASPPCSSTTATCTRACAQRIELTAGLDREPAPTRRFVVRTRGETRVPSACSRSCCSATSCRSTWPSCAGSTRRRSR